MIKNFFHLICVIVAGLAISALLGIIYVLLFIKYSDINLLSVDTYRRFTEFWNNGGVLGFTDILFILAILSYFPLCFYIWHKLNRFSFIKLLVGPFLWFSNLGLKKYSGGMPEVNIKNLKIEEKKTLEQIVKERLELENKKRQADNVSDFRQKIIDNIENKIK